MVPGGDPSIGSADALSADGVPSAGGASSVGDASSAGVSLVGSVLPAPAAVAEMFDDAPEDTLFPAERAVIATAVEKRRREFTTARFCARRALRQLGVPPQPILPGERGAPGWPDGVVGSMTHCAGYRAAAVAPALKVLTLGLDAEPAEPLPAGVLALISLPAEREQLAELSAGAGGVCWDRLLFSAKESVYKAWFPLARRWLGFEEAEVTIDPVGGSFTARLLVPTDDLPVAGFAGRWLVSAGLIVTAIMVTQP